MTAEFTTFGLLYFEPQGATLTALRTSTPGMTSSVENSRRGSDRRSRRQAEPRDAARGTARVGKEHPWPRRAARSMTCCLLVGSATCQSCGDRQMMEKG